MERVSLFIDGSLLYHDWKSLVGNKNMDLQKLINLIINKKSNRQLKRAYYYNSPVHPSYAQRTREAQQRFYTVLNDIPKLDVCLGRLQKKNIILGPNGYNISCNNCNQGIEQEITAYIDKGTDINLATDMLIQSYSKNYDVALILSRDADFCKVVREVKRNGQDVELVIFEHMKTKATELSNTVDDKLIITYDDCMNCIL